METFRRLRFSSEIRVNISNHNTPGSGKDGWNYRIFVLTRNRLLRKIRPRSSPTTCPLRLCDDFDISWIFPAIPFQEVGMRYIKICDSYTLHPWEAGFSRTVGVANLSRSRPPCGARVFMRRDSRLALVGLVSALP